MQVGVFLAGRDELDRQQHRFLEHLLVDFLRARPFLFVSFGVLVGGLFRQQINVERFLEVLGLRRAGGVDEEQLLGFALMVAHDRALHRLDTEEAGDVRHADFFLDVHGRLRAALHETQALRQRHPHEVLALRQHERARPQIRGALVQSRSEREARRALFENIRAAEHREAELLLQRHHVHAVRELQRRHNLLHRRVRRIGVELDLRHRRHEGRRLHVHFVAFELHVLGEKGTIQGDVILRPRRPVALRAKHQPRVTHPFPLPLDRRLHADARRDRQPCVVLDLCHRSTKDDRQRLRLQHLLQLRHPGGFHLHADPHRLRLPLPPVVRPPATCREGEDEQRRRRTPPRMAPHHRAAAARGSRQPARRFPRKIADEKGETSTNEVRAIRGAGRYKPKSKLSKIPLITLAVSGFPTTPFYEIHALHPSHPRLNCGRR